MYLYFRKLFKLQELGILFKKKIKFHRQETLQVFRNFLKWFYIANSIILLAATAVSYYNFSELCARRGRGGGEEINIKNTLLPAISTHTFTNTNIKDGFSPPIF